MRREPKTFIAYHRRVSLHCLTSPRHSWPGDSGFNGVCDWSTPHPLFALPKTSTCRMRACRMQNAKMQNASMQNARMRTCGLETAKCQKADMRHAECRMRNAACRMQECGNVKCRMQNAETRCRPRRPAPPRRCVYKIQNSNRLPIFQQSHTHATYFQIVCNTFNNQNIRRQHMVKR